MDFFDKLKTSLSSPLKSLQGSFSSSEEKLLKTWSFSVSDFSPTNIRLLLYRDCERRGRKCLYDSKFVIRDKSGRFSYIPTNGSSAGEIKNISDYVFGSVPLVSSSHSAASKRFHKYDGNYVWSQVFSASNHYSQKLQKASSLSEGEKESGSSESGASTPVLSSSFNSPSPLTPNTASLPNIIPSSPNSTFGKCLSLPTKLSLSCPSSATLLGLAILISTPSNGEKEPNSPQNNEKCNEELKAYLLTISECIEEASQWFASVAQAAYASPATFVSTLYAFASQLKNLVHSRLTSPLISLPSLSPAWKCFKSNTNLVAQLVEILLRVDGRRCRDTNRAKVVIVANLRRGEEVESILYLLKLLLLGKCRRKREAEPDVGIDATTFCASCPGSPVKLKEKLPGSSFYFSEEEVEKSSEDCVDSCRTKISFTLTEPKIEEEKLQQREYDSGIELSEHETSSSGVSLQSIKSFKRSVSQKFETNGSSSMAKKSSFLPDYERRYSHEFEEVSFHLGELGVDAEQSISNLALSEPNLNKLKITHAEMKPIELVDSIFENLEPKSIPTPLLKDVKLNLGDEIVPPPTYCTYCDSVGLVSKFSPLFYIQWVRTNCSNLGIGEESIELIRNFPSSRYVVLNLDRGLVRTFNFEPLTMCEDEAPSSLLLNSLNSLSLSESGEIFERDLEWIEGLGMEYGQTLVEASNNNNVEENLKKKYLSLSLGGSDMRLLDSIAQRNFRIF